MLFLIFRLAAIASWIEFFIEAWVSPGLKSLYLITALGVLVCALGDFLRKLAMFNAGRSFSHIVQSTKKVRNSIQLIIGLVRRLDYDSAFFLYIDLILGYIFLPNTLA